MSRRRNDEEIIVELNGLGALNHLLDAQTCSPIVTMHDSFAAESLVEQLMIRNVVFVSEKHSADAAHCFDSFQQLAREPGRVDEKVALRPSDQITPCAKARFGGEATVVNVISERQGKGVNADVSVVSLSGADRAGGTSHERHHRESGFARCFRLVMNAALLAVIAKNLRR